MISCNLWCIYICNVQCLTVFPDVKTSSFHTEVLQNMSQMLTELAGGFSLCKAQIKNCNDLLQTVFVSPCSINVFNKVTNPGPASLVNSYPCRPNLFGMRSCHQYQNMHIQYLQKNSHKVFVLLLKRLGTQDLFE